VKTCPDTGSPTQQFQAYCYPDKHFKGGAKRVAAIEELLQTLVAVGQARQTDDDRYVE